MSLQPNLSNIARIIAWDPQNHVTTLHIRLNSYLANCTATINHIIQIIPVKRHNLSLREEIITYVQSCASSDLGFSIIA